jgi:hypothetical protein
MQVLFPSATQKHVKRSMRHLCKRFHDRKPWLFLTMDTHELWYLFPCVSSQENKRTRRTFLLPRAAGGYACARIVKVPGCKITSCESILRLRKIRLPFKK